MIKLQFRNPRCKLIAIAEDEATRDFFAII